MRFQNATRSHAAFGDALRLDDSAEAQRASVVGQRVSPASARARVFAGAVKRWHFRGGDATHGSMHHRAPGGIGGSSFPSRVWPGQHFSGAHGNSRVTAKNLRVVKVDTDENLLLVYGSVPGPVGTYISSGRPESRSNEVIML